MCVSAKSTPLVSLLCLSPATALSTTPGHALQRGAFSHRMHLEDLHCQQHLLEEKIVTRGSVRKKHYQKLSVFWSFRDATSLVLPHLLLHPGSPARTQDRRIPGQSGRLFCYGSPNLQFHALKV